MSLPGVDSISSSNNALDSSNYLLYQSTTPSILGPRTFSQYDDETQGLEEHSSTFFCEPKEKHSHEEVKEATSLEQQDEVSNCETLPQATPSSTSTPNPTAVYQIDVNSDTASKIFNHIMNSNQMSFPHLPNSVPTARANSVACPPLYVTAQLPHLVSRDTPILTYLLPIDIPSRC